MTTADSERQAQRICVQAEWGRRTATELNKHLLAATADSVELGLPGSQHMVRVPTILAQSIRFRSHIECGDQLYVLAPADVWADFFLRMIALAPLPEVMAMLEADPSFAAGADLRGDGEAARGVSALRDALAVACGSARALNDASPRARRLAVEILKPAARAANHVLRDAPHLQAVAVDFLRRARVRSFPFAEMNRGLATGLVVAYGFPPFTDTSGLVFARRTRERAEVVDVISKDVGERARYDVGSLEVAQEFVAEHVLLDGPTSFDDWSAISSFIAQGAETFEELARTSTYRHLYSRSMWPASHLLAALIKLRHPDLMWTAEFSDPMRRDPKNNNRSAPIPTNAVTRVLAEQLARHGVSFPGSNGVYQWVEDIPYQFADTLLFTNSSQLDFMTGYLPEHQATRVRSKAVVEHHPTPSASFYRRSTLNLNFDPERFNIGYFGVFYETRGLSSITTALQRLPESDRVRLQLHVFCPRPIEMARIAADMGIADVVVAHPYLGYLDFLRVTTELDCLVVDDYATKETHSVNPYLPSKWSDYIGSGTPIWRVVEPGSVLAGMTSAYASQLGDVDGATEILRELLADPADLVPDYM